MTTVGRYKQVQVYVREFDDVKVVLLNQETIYALPTHGAPNIIYHRFFGPHVGHATWHSKLRNTAIAESRGQESEIRKLKKKGQK